MTAVLIPTASEAEWLERRRAGITASEIAIVMGLSPYSSPYALYHQKLGNLPGMEDNLVLRVGRHNEPLACELFAERHPEFQVYGNGRLLYAHSDRIWQMATPDRLLAENIGYDIDPAVDDYSQLLFVLEAKTAASYDGWGEDGSDEIPVHYRCQVLWQMDVMGVSTAFVACLFLHTRQLRVYEITLDDDAGRDLKLMRDEARGFLYRIALSREPDVDWRPATLDALKRLHPSAEDRDVVIGRQLEISYKAAVRRYKEAERRKDEMTARMLAAMGNARRAVDHAGEPVAARQVYDQKPYTRKACTVNKLVPAKPKEDKTS